jgi:hypothetical protein
MSWPGEVRELVLPVLNVKQCHWFAATNWNNTKLGGRTNYAKSSPAWIRITMKETMNKSVTNRKRKTRTKASGYHTQ